MASVEKYTTIDAVNILRHNNRSAKHMSNADIDPERSNLNYSFINRNCSDLEYFRQRKDELYSINRADLKVLAGWIVSVPQDLDEKFHYKFFEETHNFLIQKYGEMNAIQSVVHLDESGQPHLHFTFIPVVLDEKFNVSHLKNHDKKEKICMKNVINRVELLKFHKEYMEYLSSKFPFTPNILTGITKKNGGNKTVRELKNNRQIEQERKLIF